MIDEELVVVILFAVALLFLALAIALFEASPPTAVPGTADGPRQSVPTVVAAHELEQPLITDDVKQLLNEASAPVEDRTRTFSEWRDGVDIREQQLARKIQSGRTANVLVNQRAELVASVGAIIRNAADIRRQRLESELAELELQDKIAERRSFRDVRLATQRAIEERKHRKLLEPEPTPASARERTLDEHRRDRQARTRAGRELLDDFLHEVQLICETRASIHERTLQLRNVLAAFEMDEESLPADALWILKTSEKMRDGA